MTSTIGSVNLSVDVVDSDPLIWKAVMTLPCRRHWNSLPRCTECRLWWGEPRGLRDGGSRINAGVTAVPPICSCLTATA